MARKLLVEIVGDSRSLERSFARSTRSAQKFGGAMDTTVGKTTRQFSALRASIVGSGIALAIRDIVTVAAESQQVIGQTSVAVESAGLSWEQYGANIQKAIQEQSRFGFDDEALLRTFSLFVRGSKDVDESLRRNQIAMDLARARYISLEQAASLVNKAALGNAGALRRVGIDARKGASGVELLALLEQQFGGAAEKANDDAATAMERLSVQVENAKESLGTLLLPVVSNLAGELGTAAEEAQVLIDKLGTLGKVRVPTIRIRVREVRVGDTDIGGIVGKAIRDGVKRSLSQVAPGTGVIDALSPLVAGAEKAGTKAGRTAGDSFAAALREHLSQQNRLADKRPRTQGPLNITQTQRNQWFDAKIARQIDRVQDLALRKQVARLRAIAAEVRARLKITKDATRQNTLEDQLVDIYRQQAAVQATIAGNAKAAAEAAKLARQEAAEAAKVKRQEAAEAARLRKQTALFRTLGFGAGGEDLVPGIAALRARLAKTAQALAKSPLANKFRDQIRNIRKVLSDEFTKTDKELRDKIEAMLANIDDKLKEHGEQRGRRRAFNVNAMLAGLGLSPDEIRKLRGRLSQLGPGGSRPGTGVGAFGMPIVINHQTVVDGKVVEQSVTKRQQTRKRRNPPQKRGHAVANA